jgi:adenylyltransferase/sulfurtransferase
VNDRYSRQILFSGIGVEGQRKLLAARALIVGCGALGTAHAEALSRAGVGHLRLVDRDFVEPSNLQRQTMFTENDAEKRLPKAVAASNHLHEINSAIQIELHVADVNHSNIENLIRDCDVVIDGTDNFATRYLINDACVKHNTNWIYGAAVGSYGVTMTIRPHQTACLRCVFEEAPPPASAPTCDTSGVIMPIISIVSAVQVAEALKLLTVARAVDLDHHRPGTAQTTLLLQSHSTMHGS